MLLLSFASQTSHFWQLGGVTQAKMRSLLRLLVKSITGDRERETGGCHRRSESPQSPSPSPSLRHGLLAGHMHKQSGWWQPSFAATVSRFCLVSNGKPLEHLPFSLHSDMIASCFLLEMLYVRLTAIVLIALSPMTLRLVLFISQLQKPYAAEPH